MILVMLGSKTDGHNHAMVFGLPAKSEASLAADQFSGEGFEIVDQARHLKKLRKGELLGNRFTIRLRGIAAEKALVETRLKALAELGCANYFGLQRFGHEGGNLAEAVAMFQRHVKAKRPKKRHLYLSAARSYLFNQVLAARIRAGRWSSLYPGDIDTSGQIATEPKDVSGLFGGAVDWLLKTPPPSWSKPSSLPTPYSATALSTLVLSRKGAAWCVGLKTLAGSGMIPTS